VDGRLLGSFNQARREMEFGAQLFFAARHCAVVELVIVSAEMQDSVEHQNLDFLGWGVP
jgi:hypothetical protein